MVFDSNPAARAPAQWNREGLPYVRRILAVGSGKGGVGKSSVTVLLALALAQLGKRVGILDADIYGPSIPRMLGLSGQPEFADRFMLPLEAHGLLAMSIGFLTGDAPAVLRGPMVSKTLQQLLRGTRWGTETAPLDFLLIDLPPGTGDVQLSLAQAAPLDAALIVTTPQDVAVADARKALAMFGKVNIPVQGVIENMAGFADAESGKILPMLGVGGGKRLAEEAGVPLLASLSFYPAIAAALDAGNPQLEASHPAHALFVDIARKMSF